MRWEVVSPLSGVAPARFWRRSTADRIAALLNEGVQVSFRGLPRKEVGSWRPVSWRVRRVPRGFS